jgi:hypothetical protein
MLLAHKLAAVAGFPPDLFLIFRQGWREREFEGCDKLSLRRDVR